MRHDEPRLEPPQQHGDAVWIFIGKFENARLRAMGAGIPCPFSRQDQQWFSQGPRKSRREIDGVAVVFAIGEGNDRAARLPDALGHDHHCACGAPSASTASATRALKRDRAGGAAEQQHIIGAR